jgi:hypothetical protein
MVECASYYLHVQKRKRADDHFSKLAIISKLKDCGQWLIGQSCLILPMPSHCDEYGEVAEEAEEAGRGR